MNQSGSYWQLSHTYLLRFLLILRWGIPLPKICKKTNSIIPIMLFHMINNTLAFLL
ncbi:CPBP family glutamic-type intramembrane protease [Bacillus rhizoplanae]|uniref:CPBP family glutamic-type intramembrane protease n=1 Tax=Bacillus rhizoplanae TaxID=2880966 RepID=UPI003D1A9026